MATPTFTHDLTTITDGETVTGWVAVGGAMLALDPDTFIQGSNSIGIPATANSVVGAVFNIGSTVDLSNKHLFIWVNCAVPGKVANFAAGGLRIRVAGATATNYGEWIVGGKDIPWCAEGKWRMIVVDCNKTFDFTGGTPPAITAIQHVGVVALTTSALMQGFAVNIDIMRYGTKFGVSGGTDGDPVTLQNIFDQDFEVDPTNNVFGLVTKNRAGTFEINGELRLGIEIGAGNTVFSSQNELIIFQDQPCALDYLKIKSQQGSGTTKVKFGTGSGTGDARVGVNGSVFDRINSVHGREYSLALSAAITLVEFYGSTVLRAKRGVIFPAATGHEVISSSFVSCGQIDLGQILARKNTFSGHGLTDTGATTLNVAANAVDTGNITVTVAVARTYTRSAGSYITDGFAVGMVVTWSGFTNAVNNGKKVIESLTATVMTVTASQTLIAETGDANERAVVAFGYTRSVGSFVTDGFLADQSIEVSGFTTSGNNGTRVITTVSATLITVNLDTGMAAETGGGDERIQRSGITGDGALLWNTNINIKNSSFLGNTNSAATASGVQHTATGTFTYDNLTFSGNSFDVHNSSAGLVTINATNGANPATSRNTGGGSVVINNTKTLTVTVVDANTNPIPLAQVAIYKTSDNTELMNKDTETITAGSFVVGVKYTILTLGTTDFTLIGAASNTIGVAFTATGAGSGTGTASNGVASVSNFNYVSDTPIYIRVRKSSSDWATKYIPASTTGTITLNGFSATITLTADTSA